MNPILLAAGVGVSMLALLAFVLYVVLAPTPRVRKDRRVAPGVEQVSTLTKVTDRTTAAIEAATTGRRTQFGAEQLEQAGIKLEPSAFLLMVISASSVLALVGLLFGFGSLWAIPLMILFAACGPIGAKVVLSIRTSRREAKFGDQLDDTLQQMAGSLRAGHGLVRAIDAVARDGDAPTSEEFSRVVNETRLGRDLGDSLAVTAERMKSDDFSWVAQAIAINREAGGNLSEVLTQVASTIRERNQIRRQVKALSAEGRLSGIVLVCLPVGVALFLLFTQPSYFAAFFSSIVGIVALVVAVVLLIIGIIWISFTVRVKF